MLDVAIDLARQAGELLRQGHQNGAGPIASKGSAVDLVTEFDLASERLITDGLRAALPRPRHLRRGDGGDAAGGRAGLGGGPAGRHHQLRPRLPAVQRHPGAVGGRPAGVGRDLRPAARRSVLGAARARAPGAASAGCTSRPQPSWAPACWPPASPTTGPATPTTTWPSSATLCLGRAACAAAARRRWTWPGWRPAGWTATGSAASRCGTWLRACCWFARPAAWSRLQRPAVAAGRPERGGCQQRLAFDPRAGPAQRSPGLPCAGLTFGHRRCRR